MLLHHVEQGFLQDTTSLKNLSLLKEKNIEAFASSLEPLLADAQNLVIALGTGGTISMKNHDGIRIPDLDFEKILTYTDPKLKSLFHVKGLDLFHLDSSQMDYTHVHDLMIVMCYLYERFKDKFLGFLVVHGTDTMAYSAAAVSMMAGAGLPFSVVYTGAQKPVQEYLSDAPINLQNALFTLEALSHHNMAEVVIVMGDRAVRANGAIKVDDEGVNTFDSPMHRYITKFNRLRYPLRLNAEIVEKRSVSFEPKIWRGAYSHTLIVHSVLGLNPEMVREQILNDSVLSVILYSYGASTAHQKIVDMVAKTCAEKEISAFVVNPINGDVNSSYYPSTDEMKKKGVTPLLMSLPSALAKIEIGLRQFKGDLKALKTFVAENYVGEVPNIIPEEF